MIMRTVKNKIMDSVMITTNSIKQKMKENLKKRTELNALFVHLEQIFEVFHLRCWFCFP